MAETENEDTGDQVEAIAALADPAEHPTDPHTLVEEWRKEYLEVPES